VIASVHAIRVSRCRAPYAAFMGARGFPSRIFTASPPSLGRRRPQLGRPPSMSEQVDRPSRPGLSRQGRYSDEEMRW
jgi:hypothetical protein